MNAAIEDYLAMDFPDGMKAAHRDGVIDSVVFLDQCVAQGLSVEKLTLAQVIDLNTEAFLKDIGPLTLSNQYMQWIVHFMDLARVFSRPTKHTQHLSLIHI